ncbi:PfkB family carbohydrate kinase [Roseinatronobacter sp. S2]|uniref:PfkB family carbohydrate kinase n=1 Tax=Roseinatronobacter sp. S2 TaxID=3035471 RepID=UPI002410601C|nr:PfkB family carbohydrate kinase [Roseinatronobacter sp. S2]WFE74724.1 PfkB family carbohydrate kinase [Roseinatronobacter sp. S2]
MVGISATGLVGIGDNVVDAYLERGEYYPGGNALNVAVLARRAGLVNTGYIGLIGNDAEGAHVRASMIAEGLSDGNLREAIGPNGKAEVTLDAQGDRVFLRSNKGGISRKLSLRMDADDLSLIERLGHVHTSCFSYLEGELSRIRRLVRGLSFDFSTQRAPEYLAQVCPHVTMACFSAADLDDDGCIALIEQVRGFGVSTVAITRGVQDALWMVDGTLFRQSKKAADVVDTMGAGDAFIAAYLASSIQGAAPVVALDAAATFAAKACGWFGAFGHPHPMDVDEEMLV